MTRQNNFSVTSGLTDHSRRVLIKTLVLAIPGIVISPHYVHALENLEKIDKKISEIDKSTFFHFIRTIIPGTDHYCSSIVNELSNEFYGFKKYIPTLAKNLNDSSQQKFLRSFFELNDEEKMIVVEEGTKEGIFKKQIYYAAIYVIQVIVFTGLCEKNQSCSIIDFPGNKRGPFITYSHYDQLNVKSSGINGNPI